MSITKERTFEQLKAVKEPIKDVSYYKRGKIQFVKQTLTKENPAQHASSSAASFYSELVGAKHVDSLSQTNLCSTCGVHVSDEANHLRSIVHLSAASTKIQSPLTPISVSEENPGYRYMSKYGWSPIQRKGLGAVGREGGRLPIKVSKKNDNLGVGGDRKAIGQVKKPVVGQTKKQLIEEENKQKVKQRTIARELR